ncbi:SCO2522 family protein [Stackebrandtia albiflava]|uniref:SCO2522 family protein n=1 Tax=Stackebrandtia albiflava TaxID=406432 RepID=UPI001FCF04A4|nr:SCO2522 family protein [Stackebrandtia albiflava]
MTEPAAVARFDEDEATPRTDGQPLSHLSVELGHLYREDYARDDAALVEYFRRVGSWYEAARDIAARELAPVRPRVCTTFLVDDYSGGIPPPNELIPRVVRLAGEAGVTIDYVARESGCAHTGDSAVAPLVAARLVDEPPPGTTGVRPPASVTGWLSNGERSTAGAGRPAMAPSPQWTPPRENAGNPHSVFVDVEMWNLGADRLPRWSCAFLAAVWQLLRLGLLRDEGRLVAVPEPVPERLDVPWRDLPAVMRSTPRPAPFAAYRTLSIMDSRFLKTEHAVRTLIGAFAAQRPVLEQLARRAGQEGIGLPDVVADRIGYVFLGPSWR